MISATRWMAAGVSARLQNGRLAGWPALAVAVGLLGRTALADWPNFRGVQSRGSSNAADGPSDWDLEKMVAWKIDLPGRGPASPIVVGNRVYVTASSGIRQDRLHVLAFDAADGHKLWERQFWATGRTITHPQSAVAAPTPACDGKRLVAFFASNDLAALDLDGNLLWYRGLGRDYPRAGNDAGMASSPVIAVDTVIVQSDSQGDAFVLGIDLADGTTRWRSDRQRQASWTSPVLWSDAAGGRAAALVQSPTELTALDVADGHPLWQYTAACDGISSPTVADGVIYVASAGVTALRPTPGANTPDVIWKTNQLQPGAASSLITGGKVFVINRGGVLTAANAADGQIAARTRLEGAFWGTPALCGNHLVVGNFDGNVLAVELDPTGAGQIVGKIALGEKLQASPAIADQAIYIRSDEHLWKLATPAK